MSTPTGTWRASALVFWRLAWPIALTGQLAVLAEAIVIF